VLKHASSQYTLTDNIGERLVVPVSRADDFAYFLPSETDAIKSYYLEYGYVVVRGLVPVEAIERANALFDTEILPSKCFIYRQATANPERQGADLPLPALCREPRGSGICEEPRPAADGLAPIWSAGEVLGGPGDVYPLQ